MRHKAKETVEREYTAKVTCDWCGGEIKAGLFETLNAELEGQVGDSSYPEGGHFVEYRADFCKACFFKVVDLLRGQGVTVQEEEVDW